MSELSKAVGTWIINNLGWTVVLLFVIISCLFKLTKREIDPLGWILAKIGSALTKTLQTDFDSKLSDIKTDLDSFKVQSKNSCDILQRRMDQMEESNDMQTVRQIKTHVLNFANSCLNKQRHTKQDFDNIIRENEEYEKLVAKYNLRNDVYTEDFGYIMKIYHHCQDKNSFLSESDVEL